MLIDVTTNSIQDVLPETAIPVIAEILSSNADEELKEKVVMVLGNIAGDSPKLRDKVLESGLMIKLLELLDSRSSLAMSSNGAWALLNMCCGKDPAPDPQLISRCIPTLAKLINHDDFYVISDACWALSNMCEGSKFLIQIVVNAKVCPRLVELLAFKKSNSVIASAVHTIGNIVAGSAVLTQIIIDCNALPLICELLRHEKAHIVKDACWIISNIAVGKSDQIQTLIDANVFPHILNLLHAGNDEIQLEAAWAIRQVISRRRTTLPQLNRLVDIGLIPSLCQMTKTTDDNILRLVLKTLREILNFEIAEHLTEFQKHCCELSEPSFDVFNLINRFHSSCHSNPKP